MKRIYVRTCTQASALRRTQNLYNLLIDCTPVRAELHILKAMVKTNNVIVVYTPYWKNVEANTEVEQYKIEKLAATEKEEEEQEKEIAKIIADMNDRRVTEKEELQQYRAIGTPEELKTMKEHGGFSGIELAEIAAAIKTLKEYEQIGTLEECRAAMQKQTEKKPNFEGDGYADGQLVYDTWICPNCEKRYEVDYEEYDYCPGCGQKIDWNKEAE